MRDLGKSSFPRRKFLNKRFLVIITIVVVGGALFSLINNFGGGGSSGGVILRDAQTDLKPVNIASSVKVEGGVDLKTETAKFTDVKHGGSAKAQATRAYGGGVYTLDVEATLPDPKNTYYQVWLVGSSGPVSIDYMRGSKTSWSLSLRDSDKYSKYKGIWITLERTKDELPEEHVLEGTF